MSAMGAACLIPAIADAQQAARVYRIGFLGQEDAIAFSARVEAMKKGLRDAGYEDGKNLLMEYRWAGVPSAYCNTRGNWWA
jgi:putative ABC transport system substrate-binding protein